MKNELKKWLDSLINTYYKILGLIGSVIAIDQLSKYLVIRYRLFPTYLNENVAFSLPIPWYLPWLVVLIGGMFALLFSSKAARYIVQFKDIFKKNSLEGLAIILMIGGGFSNLIDRMVYGGRVVDFIDLKWWPVFNLADSFIVCGLLLFLLASYINSNIYSKR